MSNKSIKKIQVLMQGGRSMHHLLCMWKNKTIQRFILSLVSSEWVCIDLI